MSIGSEYDAFLVRAVEEHEMRGYYDDRDDDNETRALELGNDPVEFLCWLADLDLDLSDVQVTNRSGNKITGLAALIAHAPVYIREEAVQTIAAGIELFDVRVTLGNKTADLDLALISTAPEWLRAEIVAWTFAKLKEQNEVLA